MTIDYSTDPNSNEDPTTVSVRRGPYLPIMARGLKHKCPKCGEGWVFRSYLKVVTVCENCGEELGLIRADDFPPYLTMFVVGHIIVPLILLAEKLYEPTTLQHMLIWPPLALALILLLLSPIKGACVATMWYLSIKGDEFQ